MQFEQAKLLQYKQREFPSKKMFGNLQKYFGLVENTFP